jgi:hypothetical protein
MIPTVFTVTQGRLSSAASTHDGPVKTQKPLREDGLLWRNGGLFA